MGSAVAIAPLGNKHVSRVEASKLLLEIFKRPVARVVRIELHYRPVPNRFRTMTSSTMVIKFAAVFLAVISSMAVAANGQADGPVPPPVAGAVASSVPTIVAPAMALLLAFVAGRVLW